LGQKGLPEKQVQGIGKIVAHGKEQGTGIREQGEGRREEGEGRREKGRGRRELRLEGWAAGSGGETPRG
jgi:hypothetical protein